MTLLGSFQQLRVAFNSTSDRMSTVPPAVEAYLQFERRTLPGGHVETSVLWVGKKSLPVSVSEIFLWEWGYRVGPAFPSRIVIGAIPLRKIHTDPDYEFMRNACLYMREDQGMWKRLRYGMIARGIFLRRLLSARLVYTLMVWNLACIPHGEIPSWKHVGKKRHAAKKRNG